MAQKVGTVSRENILFKKNNKSPVFDTPGKMVQNLEAWQHTQATCSLMLTP